MEDEVCDYGDWMRIGDLEVSEFDEWGELDLTIWIDKKHDEYTMIPLTRNQARALGEFLLKQAGK
jgi:hypothetical protein